MQKKISRFLVKQSKEKLTDRGSLAIINEYLIASGITAKLENIFPLPGSGRGIVAADYIRTLIFHFCDGGRHLEEIEGMKSDTGFLSLIKMKTMPGSDAVGNWLRRFGSKSGIGLIQQANDYMIKQYLANSTNQEFVFDVDGTLIESNKGDASYCVYKQITGYHPMLGWLSNGSDEAVCSYAKFRQGSASAQTDLLNALNPSSTLFTQLCSKSAESKIGFLVSACFYRGGPDC